ncbi:DUF3558 family protein [Prauserella oleivorans]|uniref:DUF3558 family protein n=1 Tax=Prauserella oleivorans TaxID=1478153 RepID=A0ABW5WGJ5_9PSEU
MACSQSEGGTAEPGRGHPFGSVAPTAASSPSSPESSGAGSSLAELDPCSLLDVNDIEKYGPVRQPLPEQVGSARTCQWLPDRGNTAADMPTTFIILRENGGVRDLPDMGQGVQYQELDGREYGRVAGPSGCVIAIGVTDESRVDVQVTGVDASRACEMVDELARLVEPKVPHG